MIRDFARENEKLVVRLIAVDGQLLDSAQIESVANMPTQDQARAMLLGLFQAPLSKFLRVLSEPEAKLLRLLDARREQHAD